MAECWRERNIKWVILRTSEGTELEVFNNMRIMACFIVKTAIGSLELSLVA